MTQTKQPPENPGRFKPFGSALRQVRNHLGPSWLCDLKKRVLDAAEARLAVLDRLSEMCATHLAGTGEQIVPKQGDGSWPLPDGWTVEDINALFEATQARVVAMEAGSMFGWEVPGADPAHYDVPGQPRHRDGAAD